MRADSFELELALGGGLLIAFATSFHLLMKGRVTGMSGLLGGVLGSDGSKWKISMLCSMVITSCAFWMYFKFGTVNKGKTYIFSAPTFMVSGLDIIGFAMGGLLVGAGTKLANGCTSGHGVCGLANFSVRSWVAVIIFVALGMTIASIRYHEPFLNNS